MGFIELEKRLKLLSESQLSAFIVEILTADRHILVELQKFQLLAGQNALGNELAPSYLDDPFFKSKESAQRYSNFKDKLGLETNTAIFKSKKKDTPNLIISGGLVHDTIFANITPKSLILDAASSILSKLEAKYIEPFGLNQTAWDYYGEVYLAPKLKQKVGQFLQQ